MLFTNIIGGGLGVMVDVLLAAHLAAVVCFCLLFLKCFELCFARDIGCT
jgi:hypothetical protein